MSVRNLGLFYSHGYRDASRTSAAVEKLLGKAEADGGTGKTLGCQSSDADESAPGEVLFTSERQRI